MEITKKQQNTKITILEYSLEGLWNKNSISNLFVATYSQYVHCEYVLSYQLAIIIAIFEQFPLTETLPSEDFCPCCCFRIENVFLIMFRLNSTKSFTMIKTLQNTVFSNT